MNTVGKQLKEARLARNWSLELAARETKIKVDRVRDLEADDYTHFTSPAYARGFVRTYARSLGLDEYRILRQLDNKLPEDDHSGYTPDSGIAYIPESAHPSRASNRFNLGLYVIGTLGISVALIILFVLFQAYRAGEFARSASPDTATNSIALVSPETNTEVARAIPVDPNVVTNKIAETAPPAVTNTVAELVVATNNPPVEAVRALPVDSSVPTNATPVGVAASSVDAMVKTPPRALPVDPAELAAEVPTAVNATAAAAATVPNSPPPAPAISPSARESNDGPVHLSAASVPAPPEAAAEPSTPAGPAPTANPAVATSAEEGSFTNTTDKRLVLTASHDSFIRVTSLDGSDKERVLYASILRTGQSVGFDSHKCSINVANPAAVDITLDGVNYGPHSDQESPDTFVVESHQP